MTLRHVSWPLVIALHSLLPPPETPVWLCPLGIFSKSLLVALGELDELPYFPIHQTQQLHIHQQGHTLWSPCYPPLQAKKEEQPRGAQRACLFCPSSCLT